MQNQDNILPQLKVKETGIYDLNIPQKDNTYAYLGIITLNNKIYIDPQIQVIGI